MRILLCCLCLSMSVACFTSTPVRDAPLPKEEQAKLRCILTGRWKLAAIDGKPMHISHQEWVFREDGTGEYIQRPGTGDGAQFVYAGTRPYSWTLPGRNITLTNGGTTTVYRADAFSPQRMTWFNYVSSDAFTIQRIGPPNTCASP